MPLWSIQILEPPPILFLSSPTKKKTPIKPEDPDVRTEALHKSNSHAFNLWCQERKGQIDPVHLSVWRGVELFTCTWCVFIQLMEEYDEDEIGALDHEDLTGTIEPDSVRLNALADEFLKSQQSES